MSDTAKLRKPDFASRVNEPSGSVARDERGNAVWKWKGSDDELPAAIADAGFHATGQAAPAAVPPTILTTAAKSGYNPYESGRIDKGKSAPKRDLRRLAAGA